MVYYNILVFFILVSERITAMWEHVTTTTADAARNQQSDVQAGCKHPTSLSEPPKMSVIISDYTGNVCALTATASTLDQS